MEDGDFPPSVRSRAHVITAVLFGAGLAASGPVAGALWSAAGAEPAVRIWVTDRDGLALIGLDAELFVRRRVPLRWPVEVEGRADGGAWVVTAEAGDALGPHALWSVAADGVKTRVATSMPLLDLACMRGGDALLVELVAEGLGRLRRLRRVGPDGTARVLIEREGLTAAAGSRTSALVGDERGRLELIAADGSGTRFAAARLRGPIVDVAPAPGGWWVLAGGGGELARVGADLQRRWSAPTGLAALQLAPVPAAEQVWLADVSEPRARRFGAGGVLELELDPAPLSGLQRGVADSSGAVLFTAPGALLAYDGWGMARPGQGGFTYLTDVARVP